MKALAVAVTVTNIAGVGYGIYFYWDQLNQTVWYLLPFVPDSPTGPFLMVVVFALFWFAGRRRSPALELLAFVELVKFGIWTVIVFWLYRDAFFAPARADLTNTLLVLHLAEALEAGILLKGMRLPALRWAGLVAGWLALSDFCDYGLGALATHPRLPAGIDPNLAAATVPVITVALTIICYLTAILLARKAGSPRPRTEADSDALPSPPAPPG